MAVAFVVALRAMPSGRAEQAVGASQDERPQPAEPDAAGSSVAPA